MSRLKRWWEWFRYDFYGPYVRVVRWWQRGPYQWVRRYHRWLGYEQEPIGWKLHFYVCILGDPSRKVLVREQPQEWQNEWKKLIR